MYRYYFLSNYLNGIFILTVTAYKSIYNFLAKGIKTYGGIHLKRIQAAIGKKCDASKETRSTLGQQSENSFDKRYPNYGHGQITINKDQTPEIINLSEEVETEDDEIERAMAKSLISYKEEQDLVKFFLIHSVNTVCAYLQYS